MSDALVQDLKVLLVEQLRLNMSAEEIEAEAPLFRDGLGLDSIDALEIAVGIEKKYGIKIDNDENAREKMYSVQSLADYISAHSA
jgi:acyl carrier protein